MRKTNTLFSKLLLKYLDRNEGVYQFFRAGAHLFTSKTVPPLTDQKETFQGLLNFHEINLNKHRFWPRWVLEQLDPRSRRYTPPSNQSILNIIHKNWTSLSLANKKINTQIDATGLCTPIPNEWSIDFWLEQDKTVFVQSQNVDTQQQMNAEAPVIETTWNLKKLSCHHQHFIDPQINLLQHHCVVRNTSDTVVSAKLYMAIQPFNTEGIASIESITYLSNHSLVINKKLAILSDQEPDNVIILNKQEANSIENLNQWEKIYHSHCEQSQCSGYLIFNLNLSPGEEKELSFKINTTKKSLIPLFQKRLSELQEKEFKKSIKTLQTYHPIDRLNEVKKEWAQTRADKGGWVFPNQEFNKSIHNAIYHLESSQTPYGITSHSLSKKQDPLQQCMTILALNRLGYFETSRSLCIALKNPKGKKTLINRCYWIIACADYIQLSQDAVFKINYSHPIERNLKKIIQSKHHQHIKPNLKISLRRSQKKTVNIIELEQTIWSFIAIQSGKKLLNPETSATLIASFTEQLQLATHYLESELAILAEIPIQEQVNLALIPQLLLWTPSSTLEVSNPYFSKITHLLQDVFCQDHIFHSINNGTGISICQNLHFLNALIMQNDPQWFKTFNRLKEFSNQCDAWPEFINPLSKGGCQGDGHDRMANALMIIAGYNSLVQETNEILTICPSIPDEWWNTSSEKITAKGLVTQTGKIDISLEFSKQSLFATLNLTNCRKKVQINLPYPIQTLLIDDIETTFNENTVTIPKSAKTLQCVFK